jgi:hypothetical protein
LPDAFPYTKSEVLAFAEASFFYIQNLWTGTVLSLFIFKRFGGYRNILYFCIQAWIKEPFPWFLQKT